MKYALLIILFTAMTALCFGIFQFDLGIDVGGSQTWTYDGDDTDIDVALGISPAVEYMMQYKTILYGLGAEYQVQRMTEYEDVEVGKFGFIPIYLVGRYQFTVPFAMQPEAVLQVGYNLLTGDDDYKGDGDLSGGIYYGIGAGVTIQQKYLIQLMYKHNSGGWKFDEWDVDMDISNSQINIGLGYRL